MKRQCRLPGVSHHLLCFLLLSSLQKSVRPVIPQNVEECDQRLPPEGFHTSLTTMTRHSQLCLSHPVLCVAQLLLPILQAVVVT